MMAKFSHRSKGERKKVMADNMSIKLKVRKNLLDDNEVKQLIEDRIKLLTSKQLAVIIGLKSDILSSRSISENASQKRSGFRIEII